MSGNHDICKYMNKFILNGRMACVGDHGFDSSHTRVDGMSVRKLSSFGHCFQCGSRSLSSVFGVNLVSVMCLVLFHVY